MRRYKSISAYDFVQWFTYNYAWLVALLAIVLCHGISVSLPLSSTIKPQVIFIPLFYIAVYCPEHFNRGRLMTVGIFTDLVSGAPFGVFTLFFLVFYEVVLLLRRFVVNRTFTFAWTMFALLSLVFTFAEFIFVSFLYRSFIPFTETIMGYILLVPLYPAATFVCAHIHLKLLELE